MANWKASTSSDPAGALGCEYDVFLNFRGEDTRHNFTDFLYDRLVKAGVHTFRDEEKLPVGDVISDRLERAINNSTLYIPVFSRTYAHSKWCLRELKLMVDNVSKSQGKKCILPIFLLVKPDEVKLKTPPDSDAPYKAAFLEHEKKFSDEVEAWKTALEKVDEHKGWVVEKNTSQVNIVESVVEKVLEMLETRQKSVPKDLVGLDDRVKHLTELLDVNHHDVRLIAIYGMGGIGKTTVVKVVFNHLSFHFGKYCSFLDDVRESSSTKDGIVELQKKLLYDVGSRIVEQFKDSDYGMKRIEKTLSTKKVLVVLDDVDKKEHIEKLIGNSSLHSGSRIIITTRNTSVLQIEAFKGKILRYEMLKMDDGPTLQLFCRHAFGGDFPSDDYCQLSSEIVSITGGLPLTIEVIGSSLKGRNKAYWEETLDRLKNVPEEEILKRLRVSYDGLNKNQQQIFLDIACFFFNEKKTDAIYMWANCSFYPEIGIDVLINRCLIKILDNDKFWMHDQLKALGRQIVREESPDDLGKQSRLWIKEEALQIIRTEERKDKVQTLSVPEITNEDFERFPNLRLLELWDGTYAGDFARCHSNLRWFSWHSSHEEDFGANNFSLDRLVVCKLYTVEFKDDSKALDLIKRARDLKVLSFTRYYGMTTIPYISKCSGLERLILEGCSSLERIESFIGDLRSLIELKIQDCGDFTNLPEEVGKLVKLEHFSLSGCEKLRELPESIGNLTSLTELDLSDTIIGELPNFIIKLKSLRILRFTLKDGTEDHDWQLPSGINTLVNLEELDLSGHTEMKGEIPDGIGELSSLRILNLEYTGICGIPRTINMLHHLQTLNLSGCHEIQELLELPTSLACLHLESESLLSVPNLSNLTNLVELLLSNYNYPGEKSKPLTGCNLRWIGRLSRLKKLKLYLINVPAPPDLASLSHLEELFLSCLDLETQLPSSLLRLDFQFFSIRSAELLPSCLRLTKLSRLEFHDGEVEDIPLVGLPQLEKLSICSCKRLQRLSIPLELMKLKEVSVSSCLELVEIQVVGLSKSLKSFCVSECEALTRISGLPHLKNLKNFTILCCSVLTIVEGLDELESRSSLVIRECPSLSRGEISLRSDREEILLDTSDEVCVPLSPSLSLQTKTEGWKKAIAWWKKIRFWRTSKSHRTKEKTKKMTGGWHHKRAMRRSKRFYTSEEEQEEKEEKKKKKQKIKGGFGLVLQMSFKKMQMLKAQCWSLAFPQGVQSPRLPLVATAAIDCRRRLPPPPAVTAIDPSCPCPLSATFSRQRLPSPSPLLAAACWLRSPFAARRRPPPLAAAIASTSALAAIEVWHSTNSCPKEEEEKKEKEKEKEKEKVVAFKLDLHNEKDKKAIKIVSGFAGVKSFSMDMEDRELTVTGDVDAVLLMSELRKWFDTHLMSIEAAF